MKNTIPKHVTDEAKETQDKKFILDEIDKLLTKMKKRKIHPSIGFTTILTKAFHNMLRSAPNREAILDIIGLSMSNASNASYRDNEQDKTTNTIEVQNEE